MPCYTKIRIVLENTPYIAQARAALGFDAEGAVSQDDATRIRREAGVLKAMATVRRLQPTAIVRRVGDRLTVSVGR